MRAVTGRNEQLPFLFGTLAFQATFHLMAEWLYSEAGNLELPDAQLWLRLNVYQLAVPVRAFLANATRVHSFWKISPHLMETASSHVLAICNATFAVTGRPLLLPGEAFDKELTDKIQKKLAEHLVERFEATGEVDKARGYDFTRALENFDELIRQEPEMNDAIYATFCSQLTSAWTAWETLATDLWEMAINHHPAVLAKLGGGKNRISKLIRSKPREEGEENEVSDREFEPRLSDFERITKGTYNAGAVMGKLLKKEFKFQTLSGIRRAYSAAFSKDHAAVDSALENISLDKLNLIRNLILHKAGMVDQIFIDGAVSIPDWKIETEIGKSLALDGALVRDLINPVFRLGVDLIHAVDKWIAPKS